MGDGEAQRFVEGDGFGEAADGDAEVVEGDRGTKGYLAFGGLP